VVSSVLNALKCKSVAREGRREGGYNDNDAVEDEEEWVVKIPCPTIKTTTSSVPNVFKNNSIPPTANENSSKPTNAAEYCSRLN
jgi:hypothetical protein